MWSFPYVSPGQVDHSTTVRRTRGECGLEVMTNFVTSRDGAGFAHAKIAHLLGVGKSLAVRRSKFESPCSHHRAVDLENGARATRNGAAMYGNGLSGSTRWATARWLKPTSSGALPGAKRGPPDPQCGDHNVMTRSRSAQQHHARSEGRSNLRHTTGYEPFTSPPHPPPSRARTASCSHYPLGTRPSWPAGPGARRGLG